MRVKAASRRLLPLAPRPCRRPGPPERRARVVCTTDGPRPPAARPRRRAGASARCAPRDRTAHSSRPAGARAGHERRPSACPGVDRAAAALAGAARAPRAPSAGSPPRMRGGVRADRAPRSRAAGRQRRARPASRPRRSSLGPPRVDDLLRLVLGGAGCPSREWWPGIRPARWWPPRPGMRRQRAHDVDAQAIGRPRSLEELAEGGGQHGVVDRARAARPAWARRRARSACPAGAAAPASFRATSLNSRVGRPRLLARRQRLGGRRPHLGALSPSRSISTTPARASGSAASALTAALRTGSLRLPAYRVSTCMALGRAASPAPPGPRPPRPGAVPMASSSARGRLALRAPDRPACVRARAPPPVLARAAGRAARPVRRRQRLGRFGLGGLGARLGRRRRLAVRWRRRRHGTLGPRGAGRASRHHGTINQ